MTEPLPSVERPNGKLYRPRKISARVLDHDNGVDYRVLVTGTHDIGRALELARKVAHSDIGREYEPGNPRQGWWRETIRRHEPYWEWDEVRGAAGVMFEIGEVG